MKVFGFCSFMLAASSYALTVDNFSLKVGEKNNKSALGAAFSSSRVTYKTRQSSSDLSIDRKIFGAFFQYKLPFDAAVGAELSRTASAEADLGDNLESKGGDGYSYGFSIKKNFELYREFAALPYARFLHISEMHRFEGGASGVDVTDGRLFLEQDEITLGFLTRWQKFNEFQPFLGVNAQPYQETFTKAKAKVSARRFGLGRSEDISTNRQRSERKDVFGVDLGVNSSLKNGLLTYLQAQLISETTISGGVGYRF